MLPIFHDFLGQKSHTSSNNIDVAGKREGNNFLPNTLYMSRIGFFDPTKIIQVRWEISQNIFRSVCTSFPCVFIDIKGVVGSADLKISKSALLSLNHHNFSNTKPIYTEQSFMRSSLNYPAFKIKTRW